MIRKILFLIFLLLPILGNAQVYTRGYSRIALEDSVYTSAHVFSETQFYVDAGGYITRNDSIFLHSYIRWRTLGYRVILPKVLKGTISESKIQVRNAIYNRCDTTASLRGDWFGKMYIDNKTAWTTARFKEDGRVLFVMGEDSISTLIANYDYGLVIINFSNSFWDKISTNDSAIFYVFVGPNYLILFDSISITHFKRIVASK